MKYAVFSDAHGNLPALELMLADVQNEVDGYICLGDTVDYGPWGNECVERIHGLKNLHVVEGNHEHDFLLGAYSGTNQIAQTFFDFCIARFNRFDLISNAPTSIELNDILFTHTILGKNIYPDTVLDLDRNYVVGHSHHQFTIDQPPFFLRNPGSVGQNRKYINVINYSIYDDATSAFEDRSQKYDEMLVINEMKRLNYPQVCIDYYDGKERAR